jgi:hypothetical protein
MISNPRRKDDENGDKVLEYMTGFVVGPTATDYMNASMYASDIIKKEVCESRPDLYEWVPSNITRYPCPEGLTCTPGVCKFKEDACKSRSELPFYDCVRRTVACDTTPSGLCEICDYSIEKGHKIVGPYIDPSESAPDGCWAGDEKMQHYTPYPHPLEAPLEANCSSSEECNEGAACVDGKCVVPCVNDATCVSFHGDARCGKEEDGDELNGHCFVPSETSLSNPTPACKLKIHDPAPYTVLQYDNSDEAVKYAEEHPNEPWPSVEAKVPCVQDEDCLFHPGVGGVCSRDPSLDSYGYCIDPYTQPYLEWRDEIQMWDDMPPSRNVCVETLPYMRRWCEMPWTRAGMNADDPTLPLPMRVKNAWKSKARPPFWYDERDGTCHVTKTYCEANLKNGGFSAGYGRNRDYWLGNTCSGGNSREITGAYDCCTKLGDSIGEFFLGRTLTTDFRELVEGDEQGFGERWGNYLERAYEDSRLKDTVNWRNDLIDSVDETGNDLFREKLQENAEMIVRDSRSDLADVIDFVSDPQLKDNIIRQTSHVFPWVHAYTWTWNETANQLYGLFGDACGLLTSEVVHEFPENVVTDIWGYNHLLVPPDHELYAALMALGATFYDFEVPTQSQVPTLIQ